MNAFLESEKTAQTTFKTESEYFTDTARHDGVYKKKPRPFCLPIEHADQNLVPEARQTALDWFQRHEIKWHDGKNGKPSNHLCDSQVCCVNFLFPFAERPEPLAELLRPVFPCLSRMLPIEDGKYVAFEWIGKENYLNEKGGSGGRRTRGANFTSADAAVAFQRSDGRKQIALIEWKYTESYGNFFLKKSKSGTLRTEIYRHLFDKDNCPIDKALLPSYDSLFYEPFYQLMRQQFLASEMEAAHELDADVVSLLHVAPSHNTGFRRVTSPDLVSLGDTATGVWRRLVRQPERFQSVYTEQMFGSILEKLASELKPWADYLTRRYPWMIDV